MKIKTLISLSLYIIVFICLYWSWKHNWSLPYIFMRILAPSLLIVKDMFLFGKIRYNQWVLLEKIDRILLTNDVSEGKLSSYKALSFLVRKYIFPFLLTVYLLYLFIEQTTFMNLHVSSIFLLIDETYLLTGILFSAISMVWWEDIEEQYSVHRYSLHMKFFYYFLTIICSAVWWYVVLLKALHLWLIWMIIANIVVLLFFFLWLLLLEEE